MAKSVNSLASKRSAIWALMASLASVLGYGSDMVENSPKEDFRDGRRGVGDMKKNGDMCLCVCVSVEVHLFG
jgi:hypothetical protein